MASTTATSENYDKNARPVWLASTDSVKHGESRVRKTKGERDIRDEFVLQKILGVLFVVRFVFWGEGCWVRSGSAY